MRHIQFTPGDVIVDIRKDRAFKAAFTQDNALSQGALRALISAYIGRNVEIITVIANEPSPAIAWDRQIRYDIRVKFDGGELANVEVTLRPGIFEVLRFEYYLGRLHTSQDIRGGEKEGYGKLMPSWQINFVSGRNLFADPWCIHNFEYYDRERNISLGGLTRIIAVELGKVAQVMEKPVEGMSASERWAAFLRYAADEGKRDLVNGLMKAEEGIAMAGEMLLTVSQDELDLAQRETDLKIELDWISYMSEARQEGRAEAREEAEAKLRQEKLESARRMKADGFTPEQIQKYTSLPPEDIAAL
jgi:predicted transposase/invertase (TIGR01784 family)